MLSSYVAQTQRLLHDPNGTLYPVPSLNVYVNEARQQIAIESQSVRGLIFYNLAANTQTVALSALTPAAGVQAIFAYRQIWSGTVNLSIRDWTYFASYLLDAGAGLISRDCSQFGDGLNAVIYTSPVGTALQVLRIDAVGLPIDLVDDTTLEALPVPWQNCVKYFAAYLAYLNSQRLPDAEKMFQLFELFLARARKMTKPTRLPDKYDTDWSGGKGGA